MILTIDVGNSRIKVAVFEHNKQLDLIIFEPNEALKKIKNITYNDYYINTIILENSYSIHQKLEAFIKKYYTNELIRGIIFFIGLGLIYFLFTLFIEYFLWLKPKGRIFLFWFFITVELFLLLRFILFPIFKILLLAAIFLRLMIL